MTYRKRLYTIVKLQCVKYFLKSSLATQGVAYRSLSTGIAGHYQKCTISDLIPDLPNQNLLLTRSTNDFNVHKFEKHFRPILSDVCAKSLQSCPVLCDPVDHSPCISKCCPWDSQARILEWVAVPSSKGSSPLSRCHCTLKRPVTFINHLFHY